jgi:hypothetical protein
MTAVMTAMTSMTMSSERRHWKQHSSRDCANERELAKHFGSPLCVTTKNDDGYHRHYQNATSNGDDNQISVKGRRPKPTPNTCKSFCWLRAKAGRLFTLRPPALESRSMGLGLL